MGMVNRVLPADELETFTRNYALEMAELAPRSLTAHKLEIQAAMLHSDMTKAEEAVRRCLDSRDYQEGIAAFLEKR